MLSGAFPSLVSFSPHEGQNNTCLLFKIENRAFFLEGEKTTSGLNHMRNSEKKFLERKMTPKT